MTERKQVGNATASDVEKLLPPKHVMEMHLQVLKKFADKCQHIDFDDESWTKLVEVVMRYISVEEPSPYATAAGRAPASLERE